MKRHILITILCTTFSCAFAQQSANQVFQNEPILHSNITVFDITLINAYPFISGEVNGIKGKFMFDTGNPSAIDINDNLVTLPNKKQKGKGIVGSGQSFGVNTNDTIAEVKLANGLIYKNLLHIKSANYSFLQNITPDYLGFIGFNFFKGYLLKLDYLKRQITFYKNTDQRKSSKDFLKGEKVLAAINFEIRKLPNHPLVKVKIGGIDLLGAFDTGQNGKLQMNENSMKSLTDRALVIPAGTSSDGDNLISVNNIVIDSVFKTSLKGVELETIEGTAPIRKALQITEPNYISFGYRFFDKYKTVWTLKRVKYIYWQID